jgi:hypothetical protein
MRFWVSILFLAGLSACAAIGDDSRYQFGVSAARPASAAPADDRSAQDLLAWKAGQICTTGYRVIRQDTVNAEGGGQIVDDHLQCTPYHPSIDVLAVSWPEIF